MTLPGPLSGFPPLRSRTRPVNGSETDVFGVSPSEVEHTVRVWRAHGVAILACDVESIGAVTAPSSRVGTALREAAGSARAATVSIGNRLIAMSEALEGFEAATAVADARVGARIRELQER
ncbi:hypothetical protein [Gordonia terrae]|uniref:hypothetical protein n=1 Tax=Gordonia terrae TaxID=2055 RepID=UPI003F6BD80F